MNKHQEKSAATRAALKTAFLDLYEVHPLEDIAIKEVTAYAGCTRTTFYQHFKSIYDILDAVERDAISRITKSIQSVSFEEGKLIEFPQAFLTLCASNQDLFSPLLKGSFSHRFKDRLRESTRPIISEKLGVDMDASSRVASYAIDLYLSGVIEIAASCIESNDAAEMECAALAIDMIVNKGIIAAIKHA